MVNFVFYHIKVHESIFTEYCNVLISIFSCSHQGENEDCENDDQGLQRRLREREKLHFQAT